MNRILILLFVLFLSPQLMAHPVVFKGGSVLTATSNQTMNILESHYSFSSHFALGALFGRLQLSDELHEFFMIQANVLAWRGNFEDSQANLYIQGAAGKPREGDSASRIQLNTDWEDRDYYTVFKAGLYDLDGQKVDYYQARLGFSPFRGKYESWQAFYIFQFDYNKEMHKHVIITPVLRLFYQNILIEFGSSLEGKSWLQLMTHF